MCTRTRQHNTPPHTFTQHNSNVQPPFTPTTPREDTDTDTSNTTPAHTSAQTRTQHRRNTATRAQNCGTHKTPHRNHRIHTTWDLEFQIMQIQWDFQIWEFQWDTYQWDVQIWDTHGNTQTNALSSQAASVASHNLRAVSPQVWSSPVPCDAPATGGSGNTKCSRPAQHHDTPRHHQLHDNCTFHGTADSIHHHKHEIPDLSTTCSTTRRKK